MRPHLKLPFLWSASRGFDRCSSTHRQSVRSAVDSRMPQFGATANIKDASDGARQFGTLPTPAPPCVPHCSARAHRAPVLLLGLPLRPSTLRIAGRPSLQYRCRTCRGRNRCSQLFKRHRRVRGRPRWPFPPSGRLPFAMPCRILVRAHGRSCSQKLRPRRGMSLPSGAPISGSVEAQHSISKGASPVSGVGENAGSPPARLPDTLSPAMGGDPLIHLETSSFIAPGAGTLLLRGIGNSKNESTSRRTGPFTAIERWRRGPPWPHHNGPLLRRHQHRAERRFSRERSVVPKPLDTAH